MEMGLNKREQVLAVVAGERLEEIPTIAEAFMDVTVTKALGIAATGDWFKDQLAEAELLQKNDLTVGASVASRTMQKDDKHHLYEYETGTRWLEQYDPTFCREAVKYPVNKPEEVSDLKFPDFHDPKRYENMRPMVEAMHAAGYFVQGCTGGIWSGSYYLCTSFDNILTWMAMEPEVAHDMFTKIGSCVLAAAEEMLERDVDSIFICDDLGSGQSLLFSREMYREFIKPWHKKLADLCHNYGKIFHLHSHGHIQDLMVDIVEAGVDILNPVGPSDHNDLAFFKKSWGRKITFLGGISTTIAQMSEPQIEQHIVEVMEIGCKGGRFMPRTESGIPMMPAEKAKFFINILSKYCKQYGKAH
jgi:uroporphyrinogen-III decarboxylase